MPGIRVVCGNCGKIEYFPSWEGAFQADWDTIERFGYNACPACPGVSVYFPLMYAQQARAAGPGEREELLQRAADATLEFDPARRPEDRLERETGGTRR